MGNAITTRLVFIDVETRNIIIDTTDVDYLQLFFNDGKNINLVINETVGIIQSGQKSEWVINNILSSITTSQMDSPLFSNQTGYPYYNRITVYVAKK